MKNISLYISAIIVALIWASCSSDNPVNFATGEDTGLHKVTFSIEGISAIRTENRSLRSASLEDMQIKHLEYWVYNTADLYDPYWRGYENAVLHDIVKEEDFGATISLELAEGNYTILFYATDADINIENESSRDPVYDIVAVGIENQMFSAKKEFTISETDSELHETIVLNRIVGKVEIVIEDLDQLPDNVQSITPVVTEYSMPSGSPSMPVYSGRINLLTGDISPWTGNPYPVIPRSMFSSINKDNPITFYTLPPGGTSSGHIYSTRMDELYLQGTTDGNFYPLDMTKPFVGQNPQVVFMRRVGKFEAKANQITRYTGKIGLEDESFSITINDNWDEIDVDLDE